LSVAGAVLETFTRRAAYLGVGLLLLCAVLNVGDIATRRATSLNIAGMVDVTQLLVMACAFLCLPHTFMREAHVEVDFVVNQFSNRVRMALMAVWSFAGAGFMALTSWFAAQAALQALANGDRSTTIGIPMVWYWVPLLFGCMVSVLVCLALGVANGRRAAHASPAP